MKQIKFFSTCSLSTLNCFSFSMKNTFFSQCGLSYQLSLTFLSTAVTVWCQMGSLLHYDVWTEGLCNLYFLDPDWLVRMIAAVLLVSFVIDESTDYLSWVPFKYDIL